MLNNSDLVISGIGLLTTYGEGKEHFLNGYSNHNESYGIIKDLLVSNYKIKEIRYLNRTSVIAVIAALLCLRDGNFLVDESNEDSIGVSLGSAYGCFNSCKEFYLDALENGFVYVNPAFYPNTMMTAPASHIAIQLGCKGVNKTISNGAVSGIDAIGFGMDLIKMNCIEMILAGGCDEIITDHENRFNTRTSEGGCIFLIEGYESAVQRSAPIYAKLLAYDSCFVNKVDGVEKICDVIYRIISNSTYNLQDIAGISIESNGNAVVSEALIHALKGINPSFLIKLNEISKLNGETNAASGCYQVCSSVLTGENNKVMLTITLNRDCNCSILMFVRLAAEGKSRIGVNT